MKYNQETYEVIRERILNAMNSDIDKREGSYTSNMISPVSVEFAKYYMELDNLLAIMFLEDSTDEFLDKKVGDFAVYRKLGTSARGIIQVKGIVGTFIPKGTTVLSQSELVFYTLEDVWLNEGTNNINVEASNVGEEYNIIPNSIDKFAIDITGVKTVTNEEIFTGGTNRETDEELRERFFEIIRRPATSGNIYHYEQWAKEVDGINQVRVKPLWDGPGTVKVIISNDNNIVDSSIVEKCKKHIEEVRPIGAEVTVITPSKLDIIVKANIIIEKGFDSSQAKIEFGNNLRNYLANCVDEVVYTRVASCLGSVEGVRDYRNLTVNDGTVNIKYNDEQMPVAKSITLSEVV